MDDSRRVFSNAREQFLRFGIAIEDSLGCGLDANGDSSGDLEYREEHSET